MADVLQVSDAGLQALAAHCETVSAELVAAPQFAASDAAGAQQSAAIGISLPQV
jgi:hypothetical protein